MSRCGTAEPLFSFSASLISTAAGGVFVRIPPGPPVPIRPGGLFAVLRPGCTVTAPAPICPASSTASAA